MTVITIMNRESRVGNHRGRFITVSDYATAGETCGAETSLGWHHLIQTNSEKRLKPMFHIPLEYTAGGIDEQYKPPLEVYW